MKKEMLFVVKEENTNIFFFERDEKNFVVSNRLVKLTFSDNSEKYTAKNESTIRVAGSQNPYNYNVVRFVYNGCFHNDVYKNSYKASGDGFSRGYGIHGLYGVRAGGYVYVMKMTNGKKQVYRQTYNLAMTKNRDVEFELVCTYNYQDVPIMENIPEMVENRKIRNDCGKTHDTNGVRTLRAEITSEYKRKK